MKSRLSAVCLCALCAGFLFTNDAQSLIGATVPFGLPLQENSGMSLSMGGASCAANADYDIMLINPAGLAAIDKTVFSGLLAFDYLRLSESSVHTNMIDIVPKQISVGIPFGVYGTIGLSYNMRTNHAVSARYDTAFSYDTAEGDFSEGLSEGGGVSVWQAGYGVSLMKKIQVGLSYERAYYSFEKSRVESFYYAGSQDSPSRDSSKTQCTFNGLRLGAVVPIGKMRIGLSGEYFFSGNAKTDSAVYELATNLPVTGTAANQTYTLRLPPSLTFGLAYDFSAQWLAAADVSLVLWKYALTGNENADVTYAKSVSIGGQYVPAPNLLTPKFWEIVRYRAGLRYTQLPSAKAYEIMVSLGTGLPIGKGTGVLDVGLELGKRVSGQFPNLTEDVAQIALGINGGRKWSRLSRGNY
jgi:long-subunit fatty acid transport protein